MGEAGRSATLKSGGNALQDDLAGPHDIAHYRLLSGGAISVGRAVAEQ
jgi:hypothetical protein